MVIINRYIVVDLQELTLLSINNIIIGEDNWSSSVSCIDKEDLINELITWAMELKEELEWGI